MHRVREGDGLTPRTGSFSKVLLAVLVLAAAGGPPVRAAQESQPAQPPGAGLSVAAPAKPAAPPPLPAGPAPDLALVFTDQVVGYVEPCG